MRILVVVLTVASLGVVALLLDELRMPVHAPVDGAPLKKATTAASAPSPARPAATTTTAPRRAPSSPPHSSLPSPVERTASPSPSALSTWRGPSVFGSLPSTMPLDEEPPRPVPAYVIVDGPRIIDHGDGSRVIITSSELEVYY